MMQLAKNSFFSQPLVKALILSAAIHGAIFCFFRIKMLDVQESALAIQPVALMLEQTPRPTSALANDEANAQLQSLVCLDTLSALPSLPEPQVPLQSLPYLSSSYSPTTAEQLAASFGPLPQTAPFYPLQLKFSRDLRKLILIEDGSCLFTDTAQAYENDLMFLTSSRYTIEYDITVDAAEGKIVECRRSKELLDKTLQRCADMVVHRLRFAPSAHSRIEGQLILTFYCTGEELQPFLKHD